MAPGLPRPEPLARREASGRQLPCPGPLAQPLAPLAPTVGAARTINPRRALGLSEGRGVTQGAFSVGLEFDALSLGHLGEVGGGEDEDLAVVADDGEVVVLALERGADRPLRRIAGTAFS
jgi:hypothetical protein